MDFLPSQVVWTATIVGRIAFTVLWVICPYQGLPRSGLNSNGFDGEKEVNIVNID